MEQFSDVVARFAGNSILHSMQVPEAHARAAFRDRNTRWKGGSDMHCYLRRFYMAYTKTLCALRIPVYGVWAFRTYDQQQRIYDAGHGAQPGNSAHNYRAAFDLVHAYRLWEGMEPEQWQVFTAIGQAVANKMPRERQYLRGDVSNPENYHELEIEGGYRFRSRYDPAHWQLKGWRKMDPRPCVCEDGCRGFYKFAIPDDQIYAKRQAEQATLDARKNLQPGKER